MCIWDKTEICCFVHLHIIIITRPGAHTTKCNHQWGNLQMGHVQQCMISTVCVDGKDAHTVNISNICRGPATITLY